MMKSLKKLNNIYTFSLAVLLLSLSGLTLNADILYKVKKSDNLDRIVSQFYKDRSLEKSQIMREIFVKNPDAFRFGNINDLKLGADLTLPDEANIALYSDQTGNSNSQNTNADFSLSDLVRSIQASEDKQTRKEITASQRKQSIKIKQLEKDGDALRKQLEQLLSDKKIRDKKLVDLEKAINESLVKKTESTLVVTKNNDKEDQNDNSETVIKNEKDLTNAISKDLNDTDASKQKSNTDLSDKSIQEQDDVEGDRGSKRKTNTSFFNMADSNILIWLLLPLLLGLAYLIKRSRSGGKGSSHTDYVDTVVTMPDNDVIDPGYARQSLEGSIKLDVAKAYTEMGNSDAAREILDDLVSQDDEVLSQQAKELLQEI